MPETRLYGRCTYVMEREGPRISALFEHAIDADLGAFPFPIRTSGQDLVHYPLSLGRREVAIVVLTAQKSRETKAALWSQNYAQISA